MISFQTTQGEAALISKIAERADREIYRPAAFSQTRLDTEMDLTACHANGCPLDLEKLLLADRVNFAHDLLGIRHHLDRDDNSPTGGKLKDCFFPRFAAAIKSEHA